MIKSLKINNFQSHNNTTLDFHPGLNVVIGDSDQGYLPEYEMDHIDRDTTNDKWENLRHITHACNSRNRGLASNNKSGVSGVYWNKHKMKWCAHVSENSKKIEMGCHKNFHNAVCARLAGEQCLAWSGCDSNSPAYKYVQRMLNE
jgi:hypothetical protein